MSTYKVIQDIEAEDKLLGPLTLRQFIYAGIVFVSGFICFKLIFVAWWLILFMLPHMALFGVLAAPFSKDQSSEVWLLAKIRFFLIPRKRIWDQSGVKQLVTVTAPRKIERHLTKNLSQTEVRSRLQALANTIDSRGWAVKNVNVNLFATPAYIYSQPNSDRLIDPRQLPQEVPSLNLQAVPDIMDVGSNPTAYHLTQMIDQSAQTHRQQLVQMMQQGGTPQPSQQHPVAPTDYWFLNGTTPQAPAQPGFATFTSNPVVVPGMPPAAQPAAAPVAATIADESALLASLEAAQEAVPEIMHSQLKTIEPISEEYRKKHKSKKAKKHTEEAPVAAAVAEPVKPPVTQPNDLAILELANNDDLNVATLARQANKVRSSQPVDGEVVISLH